MHIDFRVAEIKPNARRRYLAIVALSLSALCISLLARNADAFAIYTVGADTACNFSDVQAAVNAAAANPGDDYVWIANNKTYTNEQISVSNQDVIIEGGFTSCSDFTIGSNDTTTLRGANGGDPVFSIGGTSNVVLNNLTITGAHRTNGAEGGGIFYNGVGSLTMSNATITGNSATYGAGIDVSPSGATTLTLMSNTVIVENTADTSGGGIRIEGDTTLVAVSDQTDIAFNTATSGYGGGILVLGPARANIGSPGYGAQGVINNNTAAHGGGIAVFANQGGNNDAVVKLFTTRPTSPAAIQDNIGTINGGAVYAKANASLGSSSDAKFCAFDARIDGNTAPEGGAIYLDYDTQVGEPDEGSHADLHPMIDGAYTACGTPPPQYSPVSCAANTSCNEMSGNTTKDSQGNSTSGALVFITNNSELLLAHGAVRDNDAGHFVHGNGGAPADGNLDLMGSIIVDNAFTGETISLEETSAFIAWTTIAHNFLTASHVFNLNGSNFMLHDSIISENGPLTIVQPGSNLLTIDNVLSNDITTLPLSSSIQSGDPLFVNVLVGDYHLLAYYQDGKITASRAIDFAASVEGDAELPVDLDGHSYNQDVTAIQNLFGARDLGAYEMQPINDRVFGDAFGDRLSIVR